MISKKYANEIKLLIFIALIGAVASIVLWLFLLAVNKGTSLLWEIIPENIGKFWAYPLIVCLIGGLVIGIFRKRFGDYPEDMMTVFGTVKKTKTYPYRKMLILIIAALLPLILGVSVGPEAGMVGIITGLVCWAGENLRFAKKESAKFSEIGASVSLSVLFHAPLFGIVHMEENAANEGENAEGSSLSRGERLFLYAVATAVALGVLKLLNTFVCNVSMGFPSFEASLPEGFDYLVMFLYIFAGIILGLFFNATEKGIGKVAAKLPAIVGEVIAAGIFGLIATFLPVVQFSGEEQMSELMVNYAIFPAIGLIGVAFLKVIMTNMCIQLGLKGGHFFPLIFAAVCLGYGISLLIWPGNSSHAVFAAAVTTAATLGFTMKKPLAVVMLLFLCFPVRMVFWLLFAAVGAAFVAGWRPKKEKKKAPKAED